MLNTTSFPGSELHPAQHLPNWLPPRVSRG